MKLFTIAGLVLVLLAGFCQAQESALKDGDLVAVVGDSITEQKQYSAFIEDYLLMCKPAANLRVMQFGWGGETSWGFSTREANDMLRFKPNVATTCYGMNDGGYSPQTPEKEKHYRDSQTAVVEQMKKAGVRLIVVGSPGVVDSQTFRRTPDGAEMYNKTLAAERDIARDVAKAQGVVFADVFDAMNDVMTKAKAKYGKEYEVAGGDGVHPGANGHLVMAYAFLKALGCNGDIGTITVDLAAQKAEATEGHKVLSFSDGSVELESSRYPFCFSGDPKASAATSGIIEFFPFNDDLNRFRLVVQNPGAEKLKVTWGGESKEFSAADLAKGINLAAEFLKNPFVQPFAAVDEKVRQQQIYETPMIKGFIHSLPDVFADDKAMIENMADVVTKKDQSLQAAAVAAVKPVTHTIKVEIEK